VLLFNLYKSGMSILPSPSLFVGEGRGNGGERERRSGEENGLEITRHTYVDSSLIFVASLLVRDPLPNKTASHPGLFQTILFRNKKAVTTGFGKGVSHESLT